MINFQYFLKTKSIPLVGRVPSAEIHFQQTTRQNPSAYKGFNNQLLDKNPTAYKGFNQLQKFQPTY